MTRPGSFLLAISIVGCVLLSACKPEQYPVSSLSEAATKSSTYRSPPTWTPTPIPTSTPTPIPTSTPTRLAPTKTPTPSLTAAIKPRRTPRLARVSNGTYFVQAIDAGRLPVQGNDQVLVGISFTSNDPNLAPAHMINGTGLEACGTLTDATGHSWPIFLAGMSSDQGVPIETACVFQVVAGLDRFTWYPQGYPGIVIDF